MKKKRSIVPPQKCLFSVQPVFFATYKKNTQNKHMLKIFDLQVLFKMFFSKMYNKEKLFMAVLYP